MLKHPSLSTSSVILSGIPLVPFHLEPKYDFKESACAQRWSRGWDGRGDGGGGGVGEKQSEEVKSVNLPNTFDSFSSYGTLIFRNVYEWKGSQRYTGSFQTMWRGMENNYMIVELKNEITKCTYPSSCHFKRQWQEHSSYLSLSLHGI